MKNANPKIEKKHFDLKKYKAIDLFLIMANEKLNIGLRLNTINKIKEKLDKNEYKYYYYISNHKNKIMTIHTSKGLEADNVIIILTNIYDNPIKEEFKNKLFVAITRAKEKVFIIANNNSLVSNYIVKLLKKNPIER